MNKENSAQSQNESTFSWIGEEYHQHLDSLANVLTEMSQPVQDAIAGIEVLAEIDCSRLYRQINESCQRLGSLGWTLPMDFSPRQLIDLTECSNTDQQVERYMIEYLTVEKGKFFISIRNKVLRSENFINWRNLLEQCYEAYDRGQYLITIPALLLVIEGAIAKRADKFYVADIRAKKHVSDLEESALRNSMHSLLWRSVRMVVEKLFESYDFSKPHPKRLNRHWILHGRDQTQWTQSDALRLFNLLAAIL